MNNWGYLIVPLNTFIPFGSVVKVKAHLNNTAKYSPQSNKRDKPAVMVYYEQA
jgi:hypothetical protein